MLGYSVFLPSYSVGENCYKEIPYVTRKFGTRAVVIGGKTAMSKAKPELEAAIKDSDVEILDYIWYGVTPVMRMLKCLRTIRSLQEPICFLV